MLFPGELWGGIHLVLVILSVLASLTFFYHFRCDLYAPYGLPWMSLAQVWHVVHVFPGKHTCKEFVSVILGQ